MPKKCSQGYLDSLINASIAFGTPVPSSVNNELRDQGYDELPSVVILQRVAEILAKESFDE